MELPGYSHIEEIGRGGMGCVYKAIENSTGRIVAIKMMSNKVTCYPEYRSLFSTEANTLRQLNHPSIVKIIGNTFSDAQGNLYLPMEFVEGETISQHVRKYGAYSEAEGLQLMCQILDAMQYVYSQNKIHRDIKPSNIMLRPEGGICIIDFGIAKDTHISTGMTVGNVIGTSGYMSPEQATGLNIDHRTDIYSLGCLLYYILSGQDAITKADNDFETKLRVLDTVIPDIRQINPSISENTSFAIQKATNKNMLKRFQTPADFKAALSHEETRTEDVSKTIITIGRDSDNDITMSTDKAISQHHGRLIFIKPMPTVQVSILYEDFSTNGTGLNGKYIHQAQEHISLAPIDQMPEILLAGRPENKVSWDEVEKIYRQKTGHSLFVQPAPEEDSPTLINIPSKPNPNPSASIWKWVVLITLFILIIIIILANL